MPEISVTDEQGTEHIFPDGSTPEMIAKVMNLKSPTASLDLTNSKGEGVYPMWDTVGHKLPVPYSQVQAAQHNGFKFDTNPGKSGLDPSQQFTKDQAADPNRRGGTSLSMSSGMTPEDSTARARQIESNMSAPMQAVAGVAKGAATLARPVSDVVNYATGVSPDQWSDEIAARGGIQKTAKYGTVAAAIAPAAIAAPVATAGGLVGGTLGSKAGELIGNAASLSPGATQLLSDATGLAGGVGGAVGAKALAPVAGNAVRGAIAGNVNAPIPGTDITPMQRYAAMREMGIKPDAAEATNSGLLKGVKALNQNSLTASPAYERAQATNLNALHDYTKSTLDSMSPLPPEEGGALVQKGLLKNHADLKSTATEGFQKLDDEVGGQPIPGANQVKKMAQYILDQNAAYYKLHPELEPTKAMAIVRDLAKQGSEPIKRPPNTVTGFGPPSAMPGATPPRAITYSELHRLRSDLLDFNNTNPDLVKNQANGWISRLAGAADEAITSGEGGLSPAQVDTFRNANSAWKMMKDTYDNPQNPFYHAVRTASPSTLIEGISRTPENARLLSTLLGPDELGAIQRGVAEKMLGRTPEGNYNFKTFGGKFSRQLSPSYQNALFTSAQLEQLRNIGRTGGVLNTDLNPSGTAKLGLKQAELGAAGAGIMAPHLLPAEVGYHAGQFGVSRLMNNSNFVNLLMLERAVKSSAR